MRKLSGTCLRSLRREPPTGGFLFAPSALSAAPARGGACYDSAVNSLPTFKRYPLLLEFLVVGLLITLAHYGASRADLYYALAATDIAMHFAGGVWVGLGSILFFFTAGVVRLPWRDTRVVAVVMIASTLAVGLGWEVYEFMAGLVSPVTDRVDTLADLALDLLGGLSAFGYFRLAVAPDDSNARV